MTRRFFIFRRRDPVVALPQAPPCSDMEPLNHFAALYNAYVGAIAVRSSGPCGVAKALRRCRETFHLTGGAAYGIT